ncbi:hypothetical protein ACOMHN_036303 [Nucella lapillus]
MDPPTIREDDEAAEHDGDYYYVKAMSYLAASSSENVQSDSDSCGTCSRCAGSPDEKDDDDHFTLGFRRGLTRDHDDLHSSISSSPRGSDSGNSHGAAASPSPTLTPSLSLTTPSSPRRARERKCSIGGRFYKTGTGSEFSKIEPKRKLSDGHVHWADEFHKELTRCNPRKSYSRHPSHVSSQVKPILKVTHDASEQS